MKKRLLSILFTLALCLALLSVTALAADPVNYDVTVKGVEVTSDNKENVLGDGKVSYDADTNTLTINGFLIGGTSISGNGTTDVEIIGGDGPAAVNALTISGAKNVTITAEAAASTIIGDADITCSGNVEITNKGTGQAVFQTLTVNGAQNVTVSAKSDSQTINTSANITCSGDVRITNNGSGAAVTGALTVNNAQNVTVTANSGNAAVSQSATIACSGNVRITNEGSGYAVRELTVTGAKDVTVSANSNAPAIVGAADITCSGDVTLTNTGHGQVAANTLTVSGAQNVTVSANSNSPAISSATNITCSGDVTITNSLGIASTSFLTVNGAKDVTVTAGDKAIFNVDIAIYGATITCSGDVSITNSHGKIALSGLTITGAKDVTVTANSSYAAIYGAVLITCSGTVQLVNEGDNEVVFDTLTFNQLNGDAYTVSSGSSLSDLTILSAQEAGTTFGPQAIDAKAVQIFPIHTPGEWEHNRTQHWQVCTACGAELDRSDHTFIGRTCTVCGYTKPASTYAITVESAKNGDVTSSHKTASKGTTVTLTVTPDKGCTLETLTVTDASGSEIELTNKGDGKYTFTMPASKVTVKATFMEDNSMLNFFVDVFPSDYYYDAVLWAAENGVTGGVDDTHFAPNAPCTRAQSVTFLWRAAGCPAPQSSEMPFTDVAAGSYYYDAVLWAVENGITKGTSDSAFSPDAACSRGQIVTFLWRSQSSPAAAGENTFTDVAADSYCADAVLWAVENGITKGTSDTTFSPDATCTRAQIVTFLFRCLGGE